MAWPLDTRTWEIIACVREQLPRDLKDRVYIAVDYGATMSSDVRVLFKRRGEDVVVHEATVYEDQGCKLRDTDIARVCLGA